jgi:hypothetical protein
MVSVRLVTSAHRRLAALAPRNAHFCRCRGWPTGLGWRPGGTTANVTTAMIEGTLSMDDTRFDAWTRRQFGLVSAGLLGALLGLAGTSDQATAKHKHRKHHKPRQRCQQLGQFCLPDDTGACCGKLHCGPIPSIAVVPAVTNRGVNPQDV